MPGIVQQSHSHKQLGYIILSIISIFSLRKISPLEKKKLELKAELNELKKYHRV